MNDGKNTDEGIEVNDEKKNDDDIEKKEKKSKKSKKKQRKEEERKRKEEELKLKEEKEKEKDEDKKEEENKNDNEENIIIDKNKNTEIKKEEFIINTSTKNLNEEEKEKQESINEFDTKLDNQDNRDENIKGFNEKDNTKKDHNSNNDNIQKIIKKLKKARRGSICQELNIKEDECNYIVDKAYEIFQKEESLLKITAPLYICGDIHGQYYDLLRVFDILNYPPQSTFLFLGDYVDRGKQSLECLLLLLCLKIQFPEKIFLIRGNHESEALNKIYGFFDECKRRLSIKCFKKITNLFNIMPISALINENILCMHGGLSKDLQNVEQINKILRPTEVPDEGLLCDLLWSDPNDQLNEDFGSNERNVSITFSKDYVKNFVEKNNLDLICRAHQVVEEGFEFFADMKLVTIFTAPNYMGEFDNNGGILEVGEDLLCKFHILRPNIERSGKRRKITQLVN